MDPTTGNDVYQADCTCAGELIDCEGVAGGTALPGTPCDDMNPNTGNDMWDANCVCMGDPATSVNDEARPSVELFPNPANAMVNFVFNEHFEGRLIILNVSGQEVRTIPISSLSGVIDVSDLSNGSYHLMFVDAKGLKNPQVMKIQIIH
jgi:hypothetical protein